MHSHDTGDGDERSLLTEALRDADTLRFHKASSTLGRLIADLAAKRQELGLSPQALAWRMGLVSWQDLQPAPWWQPQETLLRHRRRTAAVKLVKSVEGGGTDPSFFFVLLYMSALGNLNYGLFAAAVAETDAARERIRPK